VTRPSPTAPRPAIHYQPLHHVTSDYAKHLQSTLHAYAASTTGLPTNFTPDAVNFVVDTGASISITYDKNDFDGPIHPVQPTKLQGIASGLSVSGIGDATYSFSSTSGSQQSITLQNVLYVPGCKVRLLCPRHLAVCSNHPRDGFFSGKEKGTLTINGQVFDVPYNSQTGLSIITTSSGINT
jgi:hypothetical protein